MGKSSYHSGSERDTLFSGKYAGCVSSVNNQTVVFFQCRIFSSKTSLVVGM